MVQEKSHVDSHVEHLERTSVLANERTYAAWIRTGLAFLATGLGGEKFLKGVLPFVSIRTASTVLITFSFLCFILAAWRYDHVSRRLVSEKVSGAPKLLLHIVSGLLAFVSISALVGIWLFHG